jgi:hypothetical protein
MMLATFLMLMCTVSLILYETMNVTVHNRSPAIESVSPVYFCNSGACSEYSVERTDASDVIKASYRFGLDKLPGGILMCEVQRKGYIESDHQLNADTTSTEAVENVSEIMRLLVIWKINILWWPRIQIVLAEHDNELLLSEDKLTQLYSKVNEQFFGRHDAAENTWLVCNNTVLETTYEIVQKAGVELKIIITKSVNDLIARPTFWIDPERQVSFLMVIYFVLIYIISLTLQSTMNVIINNQCTNIELVPSAHFTKNTARYIHLPQQVNSRSIMKVKFRTDANQDMLGGALLYHLQRKTNGESDDRSDTDKNTSISTQLLVIWGCKSEKFYSHTWLIEHESTLVWDKDRLERMHDVYNSQYNTNTNVGIWLLDDNTMLKTVCKSSHGGSETEVIISEVKDHLHPIRPLWVDSNRQVPTDSMVFCIDSMLLVLLFTMHSQYTFIISA